MNGLSEQRVATSSGADEVSRVGFGTNGYSWESKPDGKAYATFLRDFEWSHAATLTFSNALHPERAVREIGPFVRDLGRRSGSPVRWFMVVEDTYEGRAHLHGLLNVRHLTIEEILESWEWRQRETWPQQGLPVSNRVPSRHQPLLSDYEKQAKRRQDALDGQNRMRKNRYKRGIAKVEIYDPDGRWSVYITKRLGSENADHFIGGPWEKVA